MLAAEQSQPTLQSLVMVGSPTEQNGVLATGTLSIGSTPRCLHCVSVYQKSFQQMNSKGHMQARAFLCFEIICLDIFAEVYPLLDEIKLMDTKQQTYSTHWRHSFLYLTSFLRLTSFSLLTVLFLETPKQIVYRISLRFEEFLPRKFYNLLVGLGSNGVFAIFSTGLLFRALSSDIWTYQDEIFFFFAPLED